MLEVATEAEFRRRRDPGFCYICGQPWTGSERKTTDHVIPRSAFLPADCTEVFTLEVHETCNRSKSPWDERVGEVLKILHGTHSPDPRATKLDLVVFTEVSTGVQTGGIGNLDFDRTLLGWLMGFHALLYQEPLSHKARWTHSPPWPSFESDPSTIEPIPLVHAELAQTIRVSRRAGTIDRVLAWNRRVRYECAWDALKDGSPVCCFALDVYGWGRLSAGTEHPPRSCVGLYHPVIGTPTTASRATHSAPPLPVRNPLDAFEEEA